MVAERGGGTPRCNQSAQKNSGYVTERFHFYFTKQNICEHMFNEIF